MELSIYGCHGLLSSATAELIGITEGNVWLVGYVCVLASDLLDNC